jgi:hypothetical protein
LLAFSACGDDDGLICSLYVNDSLHVSVVDARGKPVPIQKVRLLQREYWRDCDGRGAEFICWGLAAGNVDVEVYAADRVLSAEVSLKWNPGERGCHASGPPLVLTILESCPTPTTPAITGEVRRDDAAIPLESVSIWLSDPDAVDDVSQGPQWFAPCAVEGSRYTCPALTAYDASYTLTYAVGASRFERQADVPATSCTVAETPVDVEMSALDCPPGGPYSAVSGRIWSPNQNAPVPSITKARARLDGGDFFACEASGWNYWCPAGEGAGGGQYDVEIEAGVQTYRASVDVLDNGCFTEGISLDFEYR